MPDRATAEPGEPDQDVRGPRRLDLEQLAVVDDPSNDVVHVVRPRRVVGHDRVERRVHAIARILALDRRRVREVVLRQVREQAADGVHRLGLVARGEMGDSAAARVDGRAAERLRVDLLVRHGAHDVRSGHEHVARALDHHGEVGHRGRVHRAAGARAEDHRDLGHHARREDVAQEDLRVAAERRDALLDPRAAGIVEPDDRRADLHREIHDLADLLGVRLGQRTAEDREVLAVDEHQAAVDGPVTRDDAVAQDVLLAEPELPRPVGDERVELHERVRVQQQVQPLAGGELAPGVLSLDADRSPALERFRAQLLEPGDPFRVRRHVRGSLRSWARRRPCAKTRSAGRHHRSARDPGHVSSLQARTRATARVVGASTADERSSRRVIGDAARRRTAPREGMDIHRTVHNSVIVWTTSSDGDLGRGVGFGHVRRPAGFRRAPGIPR